MVMVEGEDPDIKGEERVGKRKGAGRPGCGTWILPNLFVIYYQSPAL